jgi:hypothetical protein
VIKTVLLISSAFIILGCGGGGNSTVLSETDNSSSIEKNVTKDNNPKESREYRGYYVDAPLVNIDYKCGKYSGKTDKNGTFIFENGQGCKLSLGKIVLQEIPSTILKDKITIFETNITVATFLQSLDIDDTTQKIEISSSLSKTINDLNVTSIPDNIDDFITNLNKKLKDKNIVLKIKNSQTALAHLEETYLQIKDRKDIYFTNKNINFNVNKKGYTKEDVDNKVKLKFGEDNTTDMLVDQEMKALVGNWAGESHHMRILLQLRKDGTYKYSSRLGIGKYHNYYRYSNYEGNWSLQNGNSQIVLTLKGVDAPLVLTNSYPTIKTPAGVELNGGSSIDNLYSMSIDKESDLVEATYTQSAQRYLNRSTKDFKVDYFTMVAPKANNESFWSSANVTPKGYNYGHKLGLGSSDWSYAVNRLKVDPENYTFVISDESWQTMFGNRHKYKDVIKDPTKMYRWFEYFKDQMQILGTLEGTVLYIISGDSPPYWAGDIRTNNDNDPKKVEGKIIESRFPEVLERKPSNSFAGVFQMMDYLRMKYAPNVKLGYTLKTWGIATQRLYNEPDTGWDSSQDVKVMADYLNNYGVQFDFLSFNFNPRTTHTTKEYKSAARYFGAISKKLTVRDSTTPKLWIWKLSLWNKDQTEFVFTNIDFLVNECNAIGVTLGHGNDLSGKAGFSDDSDKGIYLRSWIDEYFNNTEISSIPTHATQGVVEWR